MKTRIINIGNSRGIRIPKPLIEQTGLTDEVEISVRENALLIRAAGRPRAGWADAFKRMATQGDDHGLDVEPPLPTQFDEDEWEW
jgi:antitoxin MazE